MSRIEFISSIGKEKEKLLKILRKRIATAKYRGIKIVSGYLTKAGFEELFGKTKEEKRKVAHKIDYIIVGNLTVNCSVLFDELIKYKEYHNKIFINKGIGRFLNDKFNRINKFRKSVHSKIVLIEDNNNDNYILYVGSANITKFALSGFNAEAGFIIQNNKEIKTKISGYLQNIKKLPNVEYSPIIKDSYIYLTSLKTKDEKDYIEGYFENIPTFLFLSCINQSKEILRLKKGEIIYADLTEQMEEQIRKYHGKSGNLLLILIFESIEDLFGLRYDRAKVVHGEIAAFDDTGRSIERNIHYLIHYVPDVIPFITARKRTPEEPPSNFIMQTKYRIISRKNFIEKFNKNWFSKQNFKLFARRAIVNKKIRTQDVQILKPVKKIKIKKRMFYFAKIKNFELKGDYTTLERHFSQYFIKGSNPHKRCGSTKLVLR